jgi:hypothetical protein
MEITAAQQSSVTKITFAFVWVLFGVPSWSSRLLFPSVLAVDYFRSVLFPSLFCFLSAYV